MTSRSALGFLTLAVLLSAGCGPTSYRRQDHQFPQLAESCCPILLKRGDSPPRGALLVGEVRYGQTGVSLHCSRREIHERIRKEACRMGADVIHITAEKQSKTQGACYRVRASLHRLGAAPTSIPDPSIDEAGRADCIDRSVSRLR